MLKSAMYISCSSSICRDVEKVCGVYLQQCVIIYLCFNYGTFSHLSSVKTCFCQVSK